MGNVPLSKDKYLVFVTTMILVLPTVLSGCSVGEDNGTYQVDSKSTSVVARLPEPTIRRVDPPILDSAQQRRQEEVDHHLAKRYRDLGWRIVETTQTYIGDNIDWLDPASVPGSDAEPPPRALPEELRPPPGTELQVTELDLYPELRGPEGTIR